MACRSFLKRLIDALVHVTHEDAHIGQWAVCLLAETCQSLNCQQGGISLVQPLLTKPGASVTQSWPEGQLASNKEKQTSETPKIMSDAS